MRLLYLTFFAIIFSTTACFKNSEEFVPNSDLGDVENLLNLLNGYKNSALINAEEKNLVVGPNEVVIEIPASVLIYGDGKNVRGSVVMEYHVDTRFATSIVNGRETTSGNDDVKSYFTLSFKFKQGENEVFLNPQSQGLTAFVPYTENSDINTSKLYFWKNNVWETTIDGANLGGISTGSWNLDTENGTIFGIGYKANLKSVGQFMVGQAKAKSDNIELCVNLPDNYSDKNTIAVAVLPNEKMVRKLSFKNGKFCSNAIARGGFVKVITLSEQNGNYFLGETSYKSSGNVVLTLVPKQKTVDEIWNLINEI